MHIKFCTCIMGLYGSIFLSKISSREVHIYQKKNGSRGNQSGGSIFIMTTPGYMQLITRQLIMCVLCVWLLVHFYLVCCCILFAPCWACRLIDWLIDNELFILALVEELSFYISTNNAIMDNCTPHSHPFVQSSQQPTAQSTSSMECTQYNQQARLHTILHIQ